MVALARQGQFRFYRRPAEMGQPVKCRIKDVVGNALPVSFKQTRPLPIARQSLAQREQMDLFESCVGNFLEVKIRQQKVHHHARRTARRIAMPLQQVSQGDHVFGGFQRVIVVRIFPEMNFAVTKQFVTFTVTDAYVSPFVALQQDQGTGEAEGFFRTRGFPAQRSAILPSA